MSLIIGVDFDNTIIDYDELIFQTALKMGFINGLVKRTKKDVRDYVRKAHTDLSWQEVQVEVYGRQIKRAKLINGVFEFFKRAREKNVSIFIVSHKTQYASIDPDGCDLRQSALDWMKSNHFFESNGLRLRMDQVYFEHTRIAKVKRVTDLGCTHFIDDLEETFQEETFPANVKKILYNPHFNGDAAEQWEVLNSWEKISQNVFSS